MDRKESRKILIEQAKKDIEDYKNGVIKKLPTNKEYSETFGITYDMVSNNFKQGLSQEEKDYRKKEIQKQEGSKSWETKSEEAKQKYRDMISNNQSNSLLSEEMHKASLESEGWKVERLFEKLEVEGLGWRTFFRYSELKKFLKGTEKEKVAEELLNKLQELTNAGYKLQDFICKKRKIVKFCEVKNSKNLNNPEEIEQMRAIKEIWDNFGIETELVNIHISLKDLEKFVNDRKIDSVIIKSDEEGNLFLKED